MLCPFCRERDTSVVDSRPAEEGTAVRRRRLCTCHGGMRFTTFERVQFQELSVIKSNSKREPFDRDKVSKSIRIATRKRPVDTQAIDNFVSKIILKIEGLGESEIPTSTIGKFIMEGLQYLDTVAYVRYASVYKNFTEAKDFEQFVGNLDEKSHSLFSNIAFNLAEKNLGKTKDNPSVGCVVVKNNSVISSGCTSLNGRPHAEFIALNKNINFKGSYMYVTLEPCTHYGVTPPCTNLIKKKKINKVFYFFNDPDKRTNKKAAKILKNVVQTKQIPERYKYFYESYFLNKNKHYPLIDAKIAISKDYFTINKKNKWITNTRSRKVVHLIRSNYDCIISTSKSLNKDNSILNCRINGLNKFKPDLIIIDRYLKIKKSKII